VVGEKKRSQLLLFAIAVYSLEGIGFGSRITETIDQLWLKSTEH